MPEQNEELNIEKFNPTVAEIQAVVNEGKVLTISDFTNVAQVKAVRDQRLRLKEIRVNITKQGKLLRQEALDFQKKVIGKEKELVALVEPEEERLSSLEEAADKFAERERRRELLPKRKLSLEGINDGIDNLSDEDLMDMDTLAFDAYYNKRIADKNEKDRKALEEKERTLMEADAKAAREKELREAEERGRAEAEKKLQETREREDREREERIKREEVEAKERAEKIEREAKEKVEREAREKKEKEEAEARAETERKAKLAKDKKYQAFLKKCGWTAKTSGSFYIEVKGQTCVIYKKVGEMTL